jgi:hypothetical protein
MTNVSSYNVTVALYSFRCISVGLPLLSSGQSSWLQIRRSRIRFPSTTRKKLVGLERGPLSLASTTEELLGRSSSGSGLESREYGRRDPSRWPRGTLYPQKSALTSLTSGSHSVGIVRLRTEATGFFFCLQLPQFWTIFVVISFI